METVDGCSQFCFVVASFNNELNIEKNLTSLITQTNTNWRCIYVNDCSEDNTEVLFFDLVTNHNVKSKFTYIKNDKRYGQTYSKYTAYKLVKDFEIVCILDGDDWLADSDVLMRVAEVYSDKTVEMLSSNFNIYDNETLTENPNFSTYPDDTLSNKQFRKEPNWLARHLKTGYGIFFKSIPKEYLTINNEWLKVCSDIAEYYCALELSNGKYVAIDDPMYIYNKTNSLKYSTSYFGGQSEELHKTTFDYIVSLPPCKYSFPKTYIINMAKCNKKRDYMDKQMVFQSNTNFKIIEAIDGSNNSETNALMKKYFEYMNISNSSQHVEFNRSIMIPSYKHKYNFKRQHLTRGSLGLIQSSFLLLSELANSDDDHALILEDDVYTMKNLDKNLFINKELLKGKDLVYLGCHTSKNNFYTEKSDTIFTDIVNYQHLIYGTYSIIISKYLARYILSLGIDTILQLNLSWDLLLNYIRDTEKQRFTFFLYFKQLFIPNVIKQGGINPTKDLSFYTKNNVTLQDYYIPEVTSEHTDNDIGTIMSTHTEEIFFLNS
jgi:GR25 family glycosyltransferase involved in LPS biosynthesis